ncbi:MAG: hypothetical protein EBS06_02715 [Proteobacteria bacterium]|nr:hypothetical protein [Pseudomonadota bacterium]
MTDIFNKIETSFRASLRGEESTDKLIYVWGIISYVLAFLLNKLIKTVHVYFFGTTISAVLICYFAWHIYALKKCSPKKPKLTKEEKQKLREEKRKEFGKKLMRKLLLQESFTKWDPIFISIVIDAFCIAQFIDYIIR